MHMNLRQELLAGLVCLQLVNVLHQDALVLKHITLGLQVEAVVPGQEQRKKKNNLKSCKTSATAAKYINIQFNTLSVDRNKNKLQFKLGRNALYKTGDLRGPRANDPGLRNRTITDMCLSIFLDSL